MQILANAIRTALLAAIIAVGVGSAAVPGPFEDATAASNAKTTQRHCVSCGRSQTRAMSVLSTISGPCTTTVKAFLRTTPRRLSGTARLQTRA